MNAAVYVAVAAAAGNLLQGWDGATMSGNESAFDELIFSVLVLTLDVHFALWALFDSFSLSSGISSASDHFTTHPSPVRLLLDWCCFF